MNPDATKYLIGCMDAEAGDPLSMILSGDRKFDIPEIQGQVGDFPMMQARHVRPLVQIQSGCDLSCSYCIVPTYRGKSRSIPVEKILKQITRAISNERAEVVLTGIHLGTWGKDLSPSVPFHHLIETLDRAFSDKIRIRISSLDTNEITPRLIQILEQSRTVCPHLHLPLQSGSDTILRSMKRRYTASDYGAVVNELARRIPDVCLGADVIVGFPGETDALFEETVAFIQEIPLDYLHVFPFSSRNGTVAADLPGQIGEHQKKQRVKILREVSDKRRVDFAGRHMGTTRSGVLIYPDLAVTDNYLQVTLDSMQSQRIPGSSVWVRLDACQGPGLVKGTLVETP